MFEYDIVSELKERLKDIKVIQNDVDNNGNNYVIIGNTIPYSDKLEKGVEI